METKIIAIIAVLAIVISVLAVLVITEQRRYTSYVRYTQCQGLAGIGCALQENRGSVSGLVTYGAPILCGLGLLSGVFSFGLGTVASAGICIGGGVLGGMAASTVLGGSPLDPILGALGGIVLPFIVAIIFGILGASYAVGLTKNPTIAGLVGLAFGVIGFLLASWIVANFILLIIIGVIITGVILYLKYRK